MGARQSKKKARSNETVEANWVVSDIAKVSDKSDSKRDSKPDSKKPDNKPDNKKPDSKTPDNKPDNKQEARALDANFDQQFAKLRKGVDEALHSLTSEKQEAWKKFAADLAKSAIIPNSIHSGDKAPLFELPNQNGEIVSLKKILTTHSVVLVFIRGGWCPFCSLYIKQLQEALPIFTRLSARLVVVTSEKSEIAQEMLTKNNVALEVVSDTSLGVQKSYNIVYELPPIIKEIYSEDLKLLDWDKNYGVATASNEPAKLMITPTYVIAKDGVVSYSFVESDFSQRAPIGQITTTLSWGG